MSATTKIGPHFDPLFRGIFCAIIAASLLAIFMAAYGAEALDRRIKAAKSARTTVAWEMACPVLRREPVRVGCNDDVYVVSGTFNYDPRLGIPHCRRMMDGKVFCGHQ